MRRILEILTAESLAGRIPAGPARYKLQQRLRQNTSARLLARMQLLPLIISMRSQNRRREVGRTYSGAADVRIAWKTGAALRIWLGRKVYNRPADIIWSPWVRKCGSIRAAFERWEGAAHALVHWK